MSTSRCQNCGKTRANITVVNNLNVCPECASELRRESYAQWRLDMDRVEKTLRTQDIRRQTRTVAKLSRVGVERARIILHVLELNGKAKREGGLWMADNGA